MPFDARSLATCIDALGLQRFGTSMDHLLAGVAAFDMTCGFAFHEQAPPQLVHDGYSARVSRDALQRYLNGAYLLDPFYVASIGDRDDGLWRMGELAPEEFFASEFARSPTVHPCISDDSGSLVEEVGFLVRLSSGWRVTWSLMRTRGEHRFSVADMAALEEVVPVVGSLITKHCALAPPQPPRGGRHVDELLTRAYGQHLTAAQFRVVTLVLRGHSTASAARALHLSEGTIKLHRHNAYERLGISSQSELFQLFLSALEDATDAGVAGTPVFEQAEATQ